jgi:acyl-CoA thioester hydrolase
MSSSEPFTHRIRVRYAEVDGQGVVFNAHWLTYFDETCTRFVGEWGFGPDYWIEQFDVMLVKAVLEWSGPARFDEWIDIAVVPARIGTKSVDLRYRASVAGRPASNAVITYVAVGPGTNESMVLPDPVRAVLTSRMPA